MLIGIDGGATKVSAWEILHDKQRSTFALGKANTTKLYSETDGHISNYEPVNMATQLGELDVEIKISTQEKQQAEVYVEACAKAIQELSQKCDVSEVLIGIGMPGLKTTNKRGIAVAANGPRIVDYSDKLENRLKELNIDRKSVV